ncbi:MAG: FkbM family methyltransferase [Ginsengibacter sp.]
MKKVFKRLFELLGFKLVNKQSFNKLLSDHHKNEIEKVEVENGLKKIQFLLSYTASEKNYSLDLNNFLSFASGKVLKSKAQLFQDLLALYLTKEKRKGFFVDFGATDGIELNNTYLLEKEYQWSGILAEPARVWDNSLRRNRNCFIDSRCVWSTSGELLLFNETENAILSSINSFSDIDFLSDERINKASYEVPTVSLEDLLKTYNAPYDIDYLSIDTEGAEFDILQAFNFEHYSVKIITVEHNYTDKREQICDLLTMNGYKRIFDKVSHFDDWYILESKP